MSIDLSHIRLGTSSWAYEGWQGLVYQRTYPKSRFSQDTLTEYADYGMMVFRFFVPSASTIPSIVRPVPRNSRTMRVKSQKTSVSVPKSGKTSPSSAHAHFPRYGAKAGKPNPRFLDAGAFRDLVWASAQESLGSKLGLFIFEFQRWGLLSSHARSYVWCTS